MTGSENRPEAPSHKRLPRRTGLGGRASRPQGNWAVGFASWIWMNWKCKGPHWASRAGQTRSASKSRAHAWTARSHGRGRAQRGLPCHPLPRPRRPPRCQPQPPRPCTQSRASDRRPLGSRKPLPAKHRPLATSDINQTHPDNDQWRRLGSAGLAGLQAHLQLQERQGWQK